MNEMKCIPILYRGGKPIVWEYQHDDRPIRVLRVRNGRPFRRRPYGTWPYTILQLEKLCAANTKVICICPYCNGSDVLPQSQLADICRKYAGKKVAIDFGCPNCGLYRNGLMLSTALGQLDEINEFLLGMYGFAEQKSILGRRGPIGAVTQTATNRKAGEVIELFGPRVG